MKGLTASPVQIFDRKTVADPAEIPKPPPGLRQRDLDVPASAFTRLARFGHHGAERHEIAGGVVEHLRGQFLRSIDAGGLSLGMVESGRGLHQRVEAAPLSPGTCGTIGRQRDINDAGIDARGILRREAEASHRLRPVALRKNIRFRQQAAQYAAPLLAA